MTLNHIAIVTGARGGIGRALVARLRARGLLVAAVGRDLATLAEVPADAHIQADVTTPEGATLIAPLHRTRADQAREVLRVNLESSLWMLQAWVTSLEGGPGAAVLCSSVVARIGVANHEAIAAAKGGVEALARGAAATYAAQGLRINVVAPGMTETPLTQGMLKLPAMREGAGKQYPLGGVQTAEEVAAVIDWLLSPESSRLTGQVLAVDGGFTTVRPLVK